MYQTPLQTGVQNSVPPELLHLWRGFVGFIPELLGAFVIFVFGWLVANVVGSLVSEALNRLGFNKLFRRSEWARALEKAEIRVEISEFLGAITKWILVFVVLLISVEILKLHGFASLLNRILAFIPDVIVAVLIFVTAVVLSDILEKVVVASLEKIEVGYGKVAGFLARWAVLVFALFAILVQFGIARELILILFTGVVLFFALAFGLAFGLGGKEIAGEMLRELKNKLRG